MNVCALYTIARTRIGLGDVTYGRRTRSTSRICRDVRLVFGGKTRPAPVEIVHLCDQNIAFGNLCGGKWSPLLADKASYNGALMLLQSVQKCQQKLRMSALNLELGNEAFKNGRDHLPSGDCELISLLTSPITFIHYRDKTAAEIVFYFFENCSVAASDVNACTVVIGPTTRAAFARYFENIKAALAVQIACQVIIIHGNQHSMVAKWQ